MRKSLLARIPLLTAFVLIPSCVEGSDEPSADDPQPVVTEGKETPELGKTADSVTSGAVDSSASAPSEVGDDVPSAIAPECHQLDWGKVCSGLNGAGEFVGVFHNNRGGGNTVKITIWRDEPNEAIRMCDYKFVAYGDSRKCGFFYPSPYAVYRTCVRTLDDRVGCSGWW